MKSLRSFFVGGTLFALLTLSASAQPASFRNLDAVVWGTRQLIRGSLAEPEGVLYLNGAPRPFATSGGTFSVPVELREGENVLVACTMDGSACTDTLRLTLGYRLRPELYAYATVAGRTVTLHGEVLDNPHGHDLTFRWQQDPDNPRSVRLSGTGTGATFTLPEGAPFGEYYFDLLAISGDTARARTFVTVSAAGVRPFDLWRDHAAWVDCAVTYQITPHSFERGGGFRAITRRVPELAALGVNALYLQPIFETDGGGQGYKITDFFRIRADLGTEADLRALIASAKAQGMRVLLDLVPNHTSIGHPYALDAIAHGDSSHYFDYYQRDIDRAEYSYAYNPRRVGEMDFIYYFWRELPNLNFDNPEVDRWQTEVARYWMEAFGFDGYRIDVAWGPRARDPQFFRDYRFTLKRLKPEIVLIGEDKASDPRAFEVFDVAFDWFSDPSWVSSWTWQTHLSPATNATLFLHPRQHERSGLLRRSLTNEGLGWHPDARVLRFFENNDLHRFAYHHGVPRSRMAAALLLSLPGIPLLYNGQEVGFRKADHAYRTRSLYDGSPIQEQDPDGLFPYYQHLLRLRHTFPALRSRNMEEVRVQPAEAAGYVYAYRRWAEGQEAYGVINMGALDAKVILSLSPHRTAAEPATTYYLNDLVSGEALPVPRRSDDVAIDVPARTTRLFALADSAMNLRYVAPVRPAEERPLAVALKQNEPNPFNAATTIEYALPNAGHARLVVLDMFGRRVATLADGYAQAGRYRAYLDMDGLPAGMYAYQLHTGDGAISRRMLVERPW